MGEKGVYVVYQNISSLGLCVCGLSCDCLCLLEAQIACFTGLTDGFCPALEYLTLRGKKYSSYLTALDHFLGAERQCPVSAFFADFA